MYKIKEEEEEKKTSQGEEVPINKFLHENIQAACLLSGSRVGTREDR